MRLKSALKAGREKFLKKKKVMLQIGRVWKAVYKLD
jgi:hypothetical protein